MIQKLLSLRGQTIFVLSLFGSCQILRGWKRELRLLHAQPVQHWHESSMLEPFYLFWSRFIIKTDFTNLKLKKLGGIVKWFLSLQIYIDTEKDNTYVSGWSYKEKWKRSCVKLDWLLFRTHRVRLSKKGFPRFITVAS